jgi:hypothetical protein
MGDIYERAIKRGLETGEQTEYSIREAFRHLLRVSVQLNDMFKSDIHCRFYVEFLGSERASIIKFNYEEFIRIRAPYDDPYRLVLECAHLPDGTYERTFRIEDIEDVLFEFLSDSRVGRAIKLLVERAQRTGKEDKSEQRSR